jgi:hypothetical protein
MIGRPETSMELMGFVVNFQGFTRNEFFLNGKSGAPGLHGS